MNEQKRLSAVWDSLDRIVNFARISTIVLLRNTLTKIAEFATNPKEFVFWIGTLSELNPEVLEVFCRDISTVFEYCRDKAKTRDFNHLPAVLNQYHKAYHQTVLITANLLDILTEPSIDIDRRVEKASQYIVEQKIVKLGAPPNLIGLKDAVNFEELIDSVARENKRLEIGETGEDTIRGIIQYYTSVKRAMERMGEDGIYSYLQSQRPAFYRHFIEEASGLNAEFNQPGEKFRVVYDDRVVTWENKEELQVMPITDNIQALRQLIQYLRMEWPNLYDNFIEPKREFIKGRPTEEFVTSDTVVQMAKQLLSKVQDWQFSEQQRMVFMINIMEIFAFSETAGLRVRINNAIDDFNKLRLVAQYWEKVTELILKYKWLQGKPKFYGLIIKSIKQKISVINGKIGDGGEGVLQFYLSGGTLADFFRGWVSCDCTRNTDGDHAHFLDTQGIVMDPGFFLFKVIEKNRWVGNIYSLVLKDKNGKYYFFLDMFNMNIKHSIVDTGQNWDERRLKFCTRFIKQLIDYLGSQGFDYLLISTNPVQHKFGPDLLKVVKEEYGKQNSETLNLKKLGGTEFFSEAGVNEEYVINLSGSYVSNDFQNVTGYKIALDKTTPQIIQQKQKDLDDLEKLLGEMSAEETRLSNLVEEKQAELTQLNRKGLDAAKSGKNAVATALKIAQEQKIIYRMG